MIDCSFGLVDMVLQTVLTSLSINWYKVVIANVQVEVSKCWWTGHYIYLD